MIACPHCGDRAQHAHNRCVRCFRVLVRHNAPPSVPVDEYKPPCMCGAEDVPSGCECESCGRVRWW